MNPIVGLLVVRGQSDVGMLFFVASVALTFSLGRVLRLILEESTQPEPVSRQTLIIGWLAPVLLVGILLGVMAFAFGLGLLVLAIVLGHSFGFWWPVDLEAEAKRTAETILWKTINKL